VRSDGSGEIKTQLQRVGLALVSVMLSCRASFCVECKPGPRVCHQAVFISIRIPFPTPERCAYVSPFSRVSL